MIWEEQVSGADEIKLMNRPQIDAGYTEIKLTNLSVQFEMYNESGKKKTNTSLTVLTVIFSDQDSNSQVSVRL